MPKYKIYNMDDFHALYVDGELVLQTDDYYHVGEYFENLLGVENVFDVDIIDPETDEAYERLDLLEEKYGEVTSPACAKSPDLFLAGGISGTSDWQSLVCKMLENYDIQIANPRRPGMMDDPNLEPEQVEWEIDHLERSKMILFWFPGPDDHPIAMYELGRWTATDKKIFVGCPKDYKRRVNIEKQMEAIRPETPIHHSLSEMVNEIKEMGFNHS